MTRPPTSTPLQRLGSTPSSLAELGALIGNPVRSSILLHLSDGARKSAGDLASAAGISPQAASAHLARLVEGGLLSAERQGRSRSFRLSSGETAEMIEGLANWIEHSCAPARKRDHIRRARMCYDHVAGQLGVAIHDRMMEQSFVVSAPSGPELSASGHAWCSRHGIAPVVPDGSRRPLIRFCCDWSERRPHLGGHLGAAIATMLTDNGFVRRTPQPRALHVTLAGFRFLRDELGVGV